MGLFDSFKRNTQPAPQATAQTNKPVPQANPYPFLGKSYTASILNTASAFYTDGLTLGGKAYRYPELSEITVSIMPTGITGGVANVIHKPTGKQLILSFGLGDKSDFLKAVDFANTKINQINGNGTGKKFYLECNLEDSNTAVLEVYNDYLIIKKLTKSLGGAFGKGNGVEIIVFSQVQRIIPGNANDITFLYRDDDDCEVQSKIYVNPNSASTVNQIIHFIRDYKPEEIDTDYSINYSDGETREFVLMGKQLVVPPNRDALNYYRKSFLYLASDFSVNFREDYNKYIHDFDTFLYFCPKLYGKYLKQITKVANDILVAGGVWTETQESLTARHLAKYHLIFDDYTTILKSAMLTVNNNAQQISAITSLVPNLIGGGFGVAGAVKGIATATVFNIARDAAVQSAINSAMNITGPQKVELYGRLKIDNLTNRFFSDLWKVYITLCDVLKENGKDIFYLNDDSLQKGNNVLQNIANPNFPKEQLPIVINQILEEYPYNRKIFDYLDELPDCKDEVLVLKDYFGYSDKTPKIVG